MPRAGDSVTAVRSGGLVGAIVTPPTTVIENDPNVGTGYPGLLVPPPSIIPELMALRTEILSQWDTDAAAIQADIATAKADVAAGIVDTLNDLSALRAELATEKANLLAELASARTDGQQSLRDRLDDASLEILVDQRKLLAQYTKDYDDEVKSRDRKVAAGKAAFTASANDALKAATELQQSVANLQSNGTRAKLEYSLAGSQAQDWTGQALDTFSQIANPINWVVGAWEGVKSNHQSVVTLADEIDLSGAEYGYFYFANMFPGMRSIGSALFGQDPWTLEKLHTIDRIIAGVTGVFDVATTVLAVGRIKNLFTAPCRRGWVFGKCFDGDTPVVLKPLPMGSTVAIAASLVPDHDDPFSLGDACLLLGAGLGVLSYSTRLFNDRRKKQRVDAGGRRSIPNTLPVEDVRPELDEVLADKGANWSPEKHAEITSNAKAHATAPISVRTSSSGDTDSAIKSSSNSIAMKGRDVEQKSSSWVSRGLGAVAAMLLLIGGFLSWQDAPPSATEYLPVAAAESAQDTEILETVQTRTSPQYLTVPIRDLQVMHHRVMAHNPLREEVTESIGEIIPDEWRVVRLRHEQPDGRWFDIERGVPLEEIEREQLTVGDVIPVVMEEHDLDGDFTVTEILPCPTPTDGDGQLVTTKFIHQNAEVWDLRVEGSDEVIGTTAGHSFWSEDRRDFIAISEFNPGERLLQADGLLARVESLTRRPERQTVYNIEVDGEHVYSVGVEGLLVHNACTHHMHHSIPRGIQRRLAKAGNKAARHRDVIGRPGLPNRIKVTVKKHRKIHSGKGYVGKGKNGIGGGHYNNRFHQEIMRRGGYRNVSVKQVVKIRDSLVKEFGL